MGRTEQYVLQFVESSDRADQPGVRRRDFRAEPLHDGAPQRVELSDGTVADDYFETRLHHPDGWAAYWRSSHPVEPGPIRLHGLLIWMWPGAGWPGTRVRGRVERVQVVTTVVDTSDPDRERWFDLAYELEDVDVSPWRFDRGYELPPYTPTGEPQPPVHYPNPMRSQRSVLVTLVPDTDAAVLTGAVAAHGEDLWVADRDAPVLLRIREPLDAHPTVERFVWEQGEEIHPGYRRLLADAGGCWVVDAGGVRRVDPERGVQGVDEFVASGPTRGVGRHLRHAAVATDGTLAVVVPDPQSGDVSDRGGDARDRLRRCRPGGEILDDVVLSAFELQVVADRSDAGGFLLQWLWKPWRLVGRGVLMAPHHDRRLGRVDADGNVTIGPRHEIVGTLTGPTPVMLRGGANRTAAGASRRSTGCTASDPIGPPSTRDARCPAAR